MIEKFSDTTREGSRCEEAWWLQYAGQEPGPGKLVWYDGKPGHTCIAGLVDMEREDFADIRLIQRIPPLPEAMPETVDE